MENNQMKIRPYKEIDKKAVLQLFNMNTPRYFHPDEENDLIHYLDHEVEDYFVYEQDELIVAAGGINYPKKEAIAVISWDFVHPKYQGKGIGKALLVYRLQHILSKNLKRCRVRTSQLVYPFYQKQGFISKEVQKDFWAKGLDMVLMEKEF